MQGVSLNQGGLHDNNEQDTGQINYWVLLYLCINHTFKSLKIDLECAICQFAVQTSAFVLSSEKETIHRSGNFYPNSLFSIDQKVNI